jgi:hypothetical protein
MIKSNCANQYESHTQAVLATDLERRFAHELGVELAHDELFLLSIFRLGFLDERVVELLDGGQSLCHGDCLSLRRWRLQSLASVNLVGPRTSRRQPSYTNGSQAFTKAGRFLGRHYEVEDRPKVDVSIGCPRVDGNRTSQVPIDGDRPMQALRAGMLRQTCTSASIRTPRYHTWPSHAVP